MTTSRSRVAWLKIVVTTAVLCAPTSCSDVASRQGGAGDACVDDADCAPATCQFGVCAAGAGTATTISLVFEPPAARADLASVTVASLTVRLGESLPDFSLRAPATVQGVVLFNAVGGASGQPASAEVRYAPSSRGGPVSGGTVTAHTDVDGVYAVDVAAGVYDVTVDPDRDDVTSTRVTGVVVGAGGEFQSFTLPAPEQYVVVTGALERTSEAVELVAGARVFARAVDGSVESTVDTTDASGEFLLFVPPTDSALEFVVRGAESEESAPTARFEPWSLEPDVTSAEVDLRLGDWAEPVPVRVVAVDAGGAEVGDVVVSIETEIAPTSGLARGPGVASGRYVSRGVIADATTGVVLTARPGPATVFAAGVGGSYGFSQPTPIVVAGDASGGQEVRVVVERRQLLSGVVTAEGGEPVAGASVRAIASASALFPLDSYPVPAGAFLAEATSAGDGSFVLSMPPGDVEVEVTPPLASGLVGARRELTLGRGGGEVAVVVERGGVVSGRVLDAANLPLPGAHVSVYASGSSSEPVTRALTGADGSYAVVLPVPSAPH
ncbi:MAG: carboxypeptidase regulatory-like domain-containing protein [Myxococcales bacterium]|nr:carboxypeptidase regulatory-like domain-containing protein [Myxococcales bacterium]MCB9521000.1 carboxypeptidase regulatory-like domain-containing protein [Myxococcales bacterium]MCB9531673.1 carboxypeptidase regulatory-like domain-containing protein [Myxococcales bacterium]MCB9534008.1 carboxypeptidase regulatory-like domain-containing protein [Myxococcales bacterium]